MLPRADLISSYLTWKSYTSAHLPPEEAAASCAEHRAKFRSAWMKVRIAIENGVPLSDAIDAADLWPKEAVLAVRAGEAAGQLPKVFDVLVEMEEASAVTRKMVKSMLIPPIMYVCIGILMLFSFVIFAYPGITSSVKGRAREDGIIAMMDGIREILMVIWWVPVMIGVALVGIIIAARYVPEIAKQIALLIDRIPLYGTGQRYVALSSWARMFSMLDGTGTIQDTDAVRIASGPLPEHMQRGFERMLDDYGRTGSLREAANPKTYNARDPRRRWPRLFTQAVMGGAASGRLSETLIEVAPGLEREGRHQIESALKTAGTMGLLVAAISIALVVAAYSGAIFSSTMGVL